MHSAWIRSGKRLLICASLYASQAWAWGDMGHEVIANIAYSRLTASTQAKVDKILAADNSKLTAPDFASRATWADKYRDADRNSSKVQYNATRAWHFTDIALDLDSQSSNTLADLDEPCHQFPALANGVVASKGPNSDCVISKLEQFASELESPKTSAAEKRLALKFMLHFMGDLHQPLHCANHQDKGGNNVYWDTELVQKLANKQNVATLASQLASKISASKASAWQKGSIRDWALESASIAKKSVYQVQSLPHQTMSIKDSHGQAKSVEVVMLDSAYANQAKPVAQVQLQKAGVRLAYVLNKAFKP
jgi:S1/P1 Nuclease